MLDKDYIIEHVTEEQILQILSEFGAIPFGAIKTNEIYFETICHEGSSHKLCYFRDSKSFLCYTNCGHMSLFTLIMKIKKCTFTASLSHVLSAMGMNVRHGFFQRSVDTRRETKVLNKYVRLRLTSSKNILSILPSIKDDILSYFENNVFFSGWIEEGISENTMKVFGIRWYESEKHIVIPHYNQNNKLIGIRRRSLQLKDKKNKYMPEYIEGKLYSHSLNMNLYGLNMQMNGILKTKKIVLVESEKSVMLAYEYYGNAAFVVATCGFNISKWQRDTILSLGVEEVMLAFDKDFEISEFEDCDENDVLNQEYERYIKRLYSLAHKFTSYCRTYILWDFENLLETKDSPFDKGKDVLERIMKQKIEVNTDREEEY